MSLHIFTHRICAAVAWPGYSSRAQLPLLGQHKICYSQALCDVVVLMCYTQGFRNFMQELRSQGCKVLITSQCRLGGGLQSAEQLELRSLLPEHAADLLRQAAGAALAGVPQAKRLAFTCNHNALALTVIGGFIKSLVVTTEVCTCLMCVSWCKGSAQHSQIGFSAMTARAIAAAHDRIAKRCPTSPAFPHLRQSSDIPCGLQVAIAHCEAAADLRWINPDAELPFGGSAGGAAAQPAAKRVLSAWLDRYLSDDQSRACARLSLFAASFDAAGAAAVLYGAAASPAKRAEAQQTLRTLRGFGILQERQQPAADGQLRYSMHPLLRDLGCEPAQEGARRGCHARSHRLRETHARHVGRRGGQSRPGSSGSSAERGPAAGLGKRRMSPLCCSPSQRQTSVVRMPGSRQTRSRASCSGTHWMTWL